MLKFNFAEGELLLLDKPHKWTSFDVVSKIRYALKPLKLKVGHAGTLDPLATGLLVICTGKLTKKIDELQAQEKEYTGTIVLGATTPSYDLETEIVGYTDISHLTEAGIVNAAASFEGEIQQFPPAHSAVKIDGERSYEKARRGEQVLTKSRTVTISTFEITRIALPEVDFKVVCSKGTYIRSLAHDMGQKLSCGAYLSNLRRTRSGQFKVDQAWQLPDLVQELVRLKAEGLNVANR
ncbi:tRNA pseudouridine synthase B [bacterium A37T11]|nr:tRNA pseudouridine synthase B [bacterium A37T11]